MEDVIPLNEPHEANTTLIFDDLLIRGKSNKVPKMSNIFIALKLPMIYSRSGKLSYARASFKISQIDKK